MNIMFWVLALLFQIGLAALFFFLGYLVVKTAVKNGVLEAYNRIQEKKKNEAEQ